MSIYKQFCNEIFDENGRLKKITLNYPDNFNFGYDVVDAIAEKEPDKRALVWCNVEGEEHTFSFADVRKNSNQMANVLRDAGIGHGDRVMLIMKRHYEYWFAAIALHKLGAVMIPATHMLTVSDLVYRLKASKVKAVICTTQNEVPGKVKAALRTAGMTAKLWCVQGDSEGFENLTAASSHAEAAFDRLDTLATDPMVLYFTSGTTGNPKGVIHEHSYPLAHIVTGLRQFRAQAAHPYHQSVRRDLLLRAAHRLPVSGAQGHPRDADAEACLHRGGNALARGIQQIYRAHGAPAL